MRQIQSVAFRPQQPSQRQHLYTWSTFQDNDGKDNDIDGDNEDHDDDGSGDDGGVNDDETINSARRATRLGETMMMVMMMTISMMISMRIVIINMMVRIV